MRNAHSIIYSNNATMPNNAVHQYTHQHHAMHAHIHVRAYMHIHMHACIQLHHNTQSPHAHKHKYSRGSFVSHGILFARYFSVFSSVRRIHSFLCSFSQEYQRIINLGSK